MVILVNPNSGGGNAMRKWNTIRHEFEHREDIHVIFTKSSKEAEAVIMECIIKGERHFIAAGGDGTVNALLQTLIVHSDQYPDLALGAIGLGSSNDFHKPFSKDRKKTNIPMQTDFSRLTMRDVGVVSYTNERGADREKYWLLNASIGITAEANAFFNLQTGSRMMRMAKKLNTKAAIFYAALRTILVYRNIQLTLEASSSKRTLCMTNLGIVKSPHFAGDFTYD
ncbi:MAG: diacylglycerol/lipid kinase family protein, partial [Candidatus Kapaibacterium sp.]